MTEKYFSTSEKSRKYVFDRIDEGMRRVRSVKSAFDKVPAGCIPENILEHLTHELIMAEDVLVDASAVYNNDIGGTKPPHLAQIELAKIKTIRKRLSKLKKCNDNRQYIF